MPPRWKKPASVDDIVARRSTRPKKSKTEAQPSPLKPAAKPRRNRGQLALALKMPVEVFCEIAGHLSPLDLLHVSRCSREFHIMFMSKSSRTIWEAARSNLHIPDCPPGWTEPQFARFLFENECDGCGTRTPLVNYYLRVRYCRTCYGLFVGLGTDIIKKDFVRELRDGKLELSDLNIYKLAPCDPPTRNHELTNDTPNLLEARNVCLRRRYLRDQLVDAVREYLVLRDSERILLVKEKEDEIAENNEHAEALSKWAKQYADEKAREREKQVISRLLSAGQSRPHIDLIIGSSDWNKLVLKIKPLTERSWKDLHTKLVHLINEKMETLQGPLKQRREEVHRHYDLYFSKLSDEDKRFAPTIHDVLFAPFCEALLLRKDATVKVSKEQWKQCFRVPLEDFVKEHKKNIHGKLQKMIDEAVDDLSEPDQTTGIQSSELLNHGLTPDGPLLFLQRPRSDNAYTVDAFLEGNRNSSQREDYIPSYTTVRQLEQYEVSLYLALIARSLLRAMNIEGTMEDFEDVGRVFVCARCSMEDRKCVTWPKLVEHYHKELEWYKMANGMNNTGFVDVINDHDFASDEEAAIIDGAYPTGECAHDAHGHRLENQGTFKCRLCMEFGLHYATRYRTCAEVHVRAKHDIDPDLDSVLEID